MVRLIKGVDADGDGENDFYVSADSSEIAQGFQILCWIGAAVVIAVGGFWLLVYGAVGALNAIDWVIGKKDAIFNALFAVFMLLVCVIAIAVLLVSAMSRDNSAAALRSEEWGDIYSGRKGVRSPATSGSTANATVTAAGIVRDPVKKPRDESASRKAESDTESPVAKLVSLIITEAFVEHRASEVRIEPGKDCVHVRYRIDGCLVERDTLPLRLLNAIVSQVGIVAGIDASAGDGPKYGEIRLPSGGACKLQVTLLPSKCGPSASIRAVGAIVTRGS